MGDLLKFRRKLRYEKTHKRVILTPRAGWKNEDDRFVNSTLGITVDCLIGPEEDDGRPWGTVQLWHNTGGTIVIDRLYAAVRSFVSEGAPCRMSAIENERGDLGFEVKWPMSGSATNYDFLLSERAFAEFFPEPDEALEVAFVDLAPPPGWRKGFANGQPLFQHVATKASVVLTERYVPPSAFCRAASFALTARANASRILWVVASAFFEQGETVYVLGPATLRPNLRMMTLLKVLDGQTPDGRPLVVARRECDELARSL